jgi:predicted 2-oxoglutarate/Fe(II)-dependent dioxygenase YbiX
MLFALFKEAGFLTPDECLAIRRGMDLGDSEDAEILENGIRLETGVRVAALVEPDTALIHAVEAKLDACRGRVAAALGLPLGDREGAGFIRYPAGGFYGPHRDRGDDAGWDGAARRAVALVLFLNSSKAAAPAGEFDGGLLRLFFAGHDIDVTPQAGLLVAFPATVLHEVTEVRGGTRDTVVDWFYDASCLRTSAESSAVTAGAALPPSSAS